MNPQDFKVGIDSYNLKPLGLSPFQLLDWASQNGAQGVQFSEGWPEEAGAPDKEKLKDLGQCARDHGLYLEWGGGQHIPFDLDTRQPIDIFKINHRSAEQAASLGLSTIRSCSGGLMRWGKEAIPIEIFLQEMAPSLREQRSMLQDHGAVLALETHFEFTTHELIRLFDMCGAQPGEYLGVCLDTMNLLTMLEDPVAGTERIIPWVVTTHIKDGGLMHSGLDMMSFTAPAGKGVVDFPAIFKLLAGTGRGIHLSLEDHGGSFKIPISDNTFLKKFPDLSLDEWEKLLQLAKETEKRLQSGRLEVLDRERWPEVCEARVKEDIRAVRDIVAAL